MKYGTCPVDCRYCVIRNVGNRKSLWQERPTAMSINKAVTIVNSRIPDVSILEGDIVGYNAISDPFWKRFDSDLKWFLREVSPVARLVTCVTKMTPSQEIWNILQDIPNFRLVVSVTGLDTLERIPTAARIETLAEAKQRGIQAFSLVHPYIDGMSDLAFLKDLEGYDHIDIKGLRYDPSMNDWMPVAVQKIYSGSENTEFPVDTRKLNLYGKKIKSLKSWYQGFDERRISLGKAETLVDKVLETAHITSSDPEGVRVAAIKRRVNANNYHISTSSLYPCFFAEN